MESCVFCQGLVDRAAGICRQCGRAILDNQFDQPSPLPLTPLTLPSQCPRCGETTITGQPFCHKCGLTLVGIPTRPDEQLLTHLAGATRSTAEASPDSINLFQMAPDRAGVWQEFSTVPGAKQTARSTASRFRRSLVWVLFAVLVMAVSSLGTYLVIHARAWAPTPGTTGVETSSPDTTGQTPGATPTTLPPLGTGYWHASGSQLLDAANRPVKIAGINWFGFESPTFVVHGLSQRDYRDLLRQVKSLGYNTIRLPFSDQLFFEGSVPNGISFANGMNQELQGLNGLQIMDKIVDYAGQLGVKIVLDHHNVDAGAQIPLWYSGDCSISCFEAHWQQLATHYLGNTTVIGADLDNEPHGPACWGCGDPAVDWQMEAEKLGNELLTINPHWLIFVQGVECYQADCYWWGGNLEGVANKPVQLHIPNQVVYAPHDYPHEVSDLHYFHAPTYPNNLPGVWEAHWGFIVKQHLAPLLLGEFGTLLSDASDQQWLLALVNYLGTGVTGMSWTYWALNPDSSDTGGILQNDWMTVNQQKQQYLAPLEFPLLTDTAGNP